MKLLTNHQLLIDGKEAALFLRSALRSSASLSQWHKRPVFWLLFLTMSLNLLLAPAVFAATSGNGISRVNAYAIGLLGLVVLGLGVYLLVVMLQPQRF